MTATPRSITKTIANWIKPPTATVAELEQQLTGAQQQLSEATAAEQSATQYFDQEPTPASEQAVLDRQEATTRARVHVDRAERLLVAAKERELEAHRADLRRQVAAIEPTLTRQAVLDAVVEIDKSETEHLLALAKLAGRRQQIQFDYNVRQQKLLKIQIELGREYDLPDDGYLAANQTVVAKALQTQLEALPDGDPVRIALAKIIRGLNDPTVKVAHLSIAGAA